MPVFTAAPLPLLYGWRTTVAPAPRARSAVASDDPSSTTMISCHAAPAPSACTSGPMAGSSLNAGTTIETEEGSATG